MVKSLSNYFIHTAQYCLGALPPIKVSYDDIGLEPFFGPYSIDPLTIFLYLSREGGGSLFLFWGGEEGGIQVGQGWGGGQASVHILYVRYREGEVGRLQVRQGSRGGRRS